MRVSKKIVVLGHFGVGKTSLIRRFVEDSFSSDYKVSIGVHITKKVVEISVEKQVSLILWDLEGTDDLSKIRTSLSHIVVGNKVDLVVPDELNELLQRQGIAYDYLSSAKTGGMVNNLFLDLAKMLSPDAESI